GDARRDGRAVPAQDRLRRPQPERSEGHPGRLRAPRPQRARLAGRARPAPAVSDLGKILLGFGVVMVVLGLVLVVAGNLSGRVPWLGRLPGDIHIQRGNWSFYFPLATCIVISIVLTLLFSLFGRR